MSLVALGALEGIKGLGVAIRMATEEMDGASFVQVKLYFLLIIDDINIIFQTSLNFCSRHHDVAFLTAE